MIHSGSRGLGHQVATGANKRGPALVRVITFVKFYHFIDFCNLVIA